MKFELIDRIIDRSDGQLTALKCVSHAEEYLADHFPGFAVLPGVLMLEAMVQAGRELLADRAGDRPLVLADARNVRYGNMVRPGQNLTVQVRLRNSHEASWDFDGECRVGNDPAVRGRFSLTTIDHADRPQTSEPTQAVG